MGDLEMTRLCAAAMGYEVFDDYRDCNPPVDGVAVRGEGDGATRFHPLSNDAQAMALVKKCQLSIGANYGGKWVVYPPNTDKAVNADLNLAIVECVAKMRQSRG